MKIVFKNIALAALSILAAACSGKEEQSAPEELPVREGPGKVFLAPETLRDSILIGDRVEYGVELYSLEKGTVVVMPLVEPMKELRDSVLALTPWVSDTLRVNPDGTVDMKESLVVTAFDGGDYRLPDLEPVLSLPGGSVDTLKFEGAVLPIRDPALDPKVFKETPGGAPQGQGGPDMNGYDIKDPIDAAVESEEDEAAAAAARRHRVMSIILLSLAALAVLALVAWLIVRRILEKRRHAVILSPREEALSRLATLDDKSHWAHDKQKAFYSGVTDTLKNYMDRSFGIDAPEMTTDEVLVALSGCGIPKEKIDPVGELLRLADYVKFARYRATDIENASVVPAARAFVEATSEPEAEKEVTK